MNEYIDLQDAVVRLNGAGQQTSIQRLIEAGAEGRLCVYWRNSRQTFSRILLPDGRGDAGVGCVAARVLRVSLFNLARLEVEESVVTTAFETLDEDLPMLQAQGLDHLDLMRWADESCVVSRASLRVRAADIDAMIANAAVSDGRTLDDGHVKEVPSADIPALPVSRLSAQKTEIGRVLIDAFGALEYLPRYKNGTKDPAKMSAWNAVRGNRRLFFSKNVFDKAWQGLHDDGFFVNRPK